ncbi:MAG TPA: cytochrome b [Rhizomicrobium sp.]
MAARNSDLRYGSVAMTFHWIIAVLLIANIALGLYAVGLPRGDPGKFALFQFHKSIGLTVLALSLLRLGWRLINTVPPLPLGMHPAVAFFARATHVTFYLLIILIPLSGWVMVSASPLGNGTLFFGLFTLPNLPLFGGLPRAELKPWHELFEAAHVYLAWASIALIPIHVVAALYHQLLRRDDVLRRMVPGTNVSDRA